jgi:hypothetical protein
MRYAPRAHGSVRRRTAYSGNSLAHQLAFRPSGVSPFSIRPRGFCRRDIHRQVLAARAEINERGASHVLERRDPAIDMAATPIIPADSRNIAAKGGRLVAKALRSRLASRVEETVKILLFG